MMVRTMGLLALLLMTVLLAQPASSAPGGATVSRNPGNLAQFISQIDEGQLARMGVDKGSAQSLLNESHAIGREIGVDFEKLDEKSVVVVVGETLNGPERAALTVLDTQYPDIMGQRISASKTTLSDLEKGGKLVILIGGISQNSVTAQLSERNMLSSKSHEFLNQLSISTAKGKSGTKYLVLSDKRGFVNLPRKAASYSPLAICLPLSLVPIVASAIGAVLTSLAHPLFNLLQSFMENVISSRKKAKSRITHTRWKLLGIKAREVISITAAALVLGIAISWTYAGPTSQFLYLMVLNTVICLLAGFSHEAVHWGIGKLVKIDTEYKFWLGGSVLTIFSAFLGNAFGLQGFLIEEEKEGEARWKKGVMKLAPALFTTAVMLAFAFLNFVYPMVVFQMVYSIASVLAMADILPLKPMDGYDVRRWNVIIWLIAFVGISVSFVFANFVI
jgi:hypothetical protein